MIAFLGLDWEPACLDFHRTERTVTTVSHWQVRQPLYHSSVGRWKNYERHRKQRGGRLSGDDASALLQDAIRAYRSGEPDQVERICRQILTLQSDHVAGLQILDAVAVRGCRWRCSWCVKP